MFICYKRKKFGDIKNKKNKEKKTKRYNNSINYKNYNKNKNVIQESVPFSSSFKIKIIYII